MSANMVVRGPTLRAKPGPSLFEALQEHYGLHSDNVQDLGGSSNLNLLLADAHGRYVVRVYRPWTTQARLEDMQLVRWHLRDGDVPCPQPVLARDGASWIEVNSRLVEVEAYVEHDANMDSWERLATGLPLLGRIHTLLQPLELSADGRQAPAANNIEAAAVLSATQRGIRRIREWNVSPAEIEFIAIAEQVASSVYQAEREHAGLPRQLVHGDYWDNNVLFRSGKIVLVADLDFMGERARIDDLALTLYYTNATFADDPVFDTRIRKLRTLVDAYDSGLEQPLTTAERAALPLALARAPLCFVAMIAVVDSEVGARQLVAATMEELVWARAIVRDLDRWQNGFV